MRFSAIRLDDGTMVALHQDGYSSARLTSEARTLMLVLLADRSNWKSAYPIGRGEQHWSLTVFGTSTQTVTFDDALANPNLPYDLYRLALEMLRPNLSTPASPIPSQGIDDLLR